MGDQADAQIDNMIQCIAEGGYCPDCDMIHDPQGPCGCCEKDWKRGEDEAKSSKKPYFSGVDEVDDQC